MTSTKSARDVVHRMVDRFSDLRMLLDEHLDDMDGELLPYLLMADVARWAVEAAERDPAAADALIAWLEEEFEVAAGAERDLIGLGFVETIPAAPAGDPVLGGLGPRLQQVAADLGLLG